LISTTRKAYSADPRIFRRKIGQLLINLTCPDGGTAVEPTRIAEKGRDESEIAFGRGASGVERDVDTV